MLTVVIDDNLGSNGSSFAGYSHFHVSILQFPTGDKPGVIRPAFNNLPPEERVLDFTILDSYTEVLDCILYIKIAPHSEEIIKLLKQFYDDLEDCSSNGKTEEIEWAKLG